MTCRDCNKKASPVVLQGSLGLEEYTWKSICCRCERSLEEAIRSWIPTKYGAGQRVRGGRVDCAQLIFGLLDQLNRNPEPSLMPRFSPDAAVHDPRPYTAVVLAGKKAFGLRVVRDRTIEPGDVILTRSTWDRLSPRRPGHAMMAGVRRGTAVHAIPNTGVTMTTLAVTTGILRILRPEGKNKW